jgi:hypothetical protein
LDLECSQDGVLMPLDGRGRWRHLLQGHTVLGREGVQLALGLGSIDGEQHAIVHRPEVKPEARCVVLELAPSSHDKSTAVRARRELESIRIGEVAAPGEPNVICTGRNIPDGVLAGYDFREACPLPRTDCGDRDRPAGHWSRIRILDAGMEGRGESH